MSKEHQQMVVDRIEAKLEEMKAEENSPIFEEDRKVLSLFDRLRLQVNLPDGSVLLPEWKEEGVAKRFANVNEYTEWSKEKEVQLRQQVENKLDPMQSYLISYKAIERPFTGDYWDTMTVGLYNCAVCSQKLFSSTQKFRSSCGHAAFWTYLPHTLKTSEDYLEYKTPTQAILDIKHSEAKPTKRVSCSNCDTHMGLMFEDGPAPYYKRIIVNSALLIFEKLEDFISPDLINRAKRLNAFKREAERIRLENDVINTKKKEFPEIFKFIDEHIVPNEGPLSSSRFKENEELMFRLKF